MRRAEVLYILLLMVPLVSEGARQFPDEPRPWQWSPSRTTMSSSPPNEFAWGDGGEFSTIISANLPLPESTSQSTTQISTTPSKTSEILTQSTISTKIAEVSSLSTNFNKITEISNTTPNKITEITTQSTISTKITKVSTLSTTSNKITEISNTAPNKITEITIQSTTPIKITDTLTQISVQTTTKMSQDPTSIIITPATIGIPQSTIITSANQSSSISIVTTVTPESKTSTTFKTTEISVAATGQFSNQTKITDPDNKSAINNITKSTENVLFSTGLGAKNPNTAMTPDPRRGILSTRVTEIREELTSQGNGPGVTLTTTSPEISKKKQPEQNANKLPFDFENQNTFTNINKVTPEFGNKNPTFSDTVTKQNINSNGEKDTRVKFNPEFNTEFKNGNTPNRNNVPDTQRYLPNNPQNIPGREVATDNGNVNPTDVGGGGGGGDNDEMPTRSFQTTLDDRTTELRDREFTTDRTATELWSFRPTDDITRTNPNWPTRNNGRDTTPKFNPGWNPRKNNPDNDFDTERVTPTRTNFLPRLPTTQFVFVKKDPNNKREGWNRHSVLGIGDK